MWSELLAIAALAATGTVLCIAFRWLIDLCWMILMSKVVLGGTVMVFAVVGFGIYSATGALHLSLAAALIAAPLIVRPSADFLMWLYDLSPVEIGSEWPPLALEEWEEYRTRLKDARPSWMWDYYRLRRRALQRIKFLESDLEELGDDELDNMPGDAEVAEASPVGLS